MAAQEKPTAPALPRTRPMQIAARQLRHPSEYGRPIRPHWVARLVREWDDDKVGDLLVSQRADGRFYVIAGNHRVKSRLDAGQPFYRFDCKVYSGLSIPEEASIYLSQDNERLRHTLADDFPAMLAQDDPTAKGVAQVLADVGLEIAPYGMAGFSPRRVRAVSSLLGAYESNGPDNLRLALELLRDEWGAEMVRLQRTKKSVYSEATLNSLPAFLRLYGSTEHPVEVEWLRKAMQRAHFSGWEDAWHRHRNAASSRPQGGVAIVYGVLAWLDLYNYGRREQNRLDEMVVRSATHTLGRKKRLSRPGGQA